uniref:Glutamate/phenylalanine/leucine/valine/L-tryptophan dehydrogenase C-terminal domain-containing protein n=1 Tax=Corethron hystrix TaxID=216773 RepID=A0A7S1BGW0_9STRA|mmetsp:Transcript_26144/g.60098  ORF Transcript_26144/g.60098 Transcript_26144/m.60098 type:complete len:587 (+) Transcript_26144:125-1885(+)
MITNLILLVLLSNAAAKPFIRTTRNNIFAFQSKQAPTVTAPLSKNDFFTIIEDPKKRGATVLEAPVEQEGVKLYIAIDSASFQNKDRPGNGGIRLLSYQSKEHAIDDAVRLAKGMTRKHDMFRTGFSGAKVVIDHDHEDLSVVKRDTLMRDAAKALKALDGSMYTGCDLNTSDEDMDFLTKFTDDKYVLAGRNSRVDTNAATASSVIGSILGVLDVNNEIISELTFTVQGCGKVGSIVARELLRYGAKCVQTCDLFSENAEIPGCVPIDDWTKSTCDFFVPCANSLAITETVANNFPEGVKYCVGAANSPYANERARSVFDERGVLHVPESISSAGAILADSVEWYDIDLYQTVERSLMYGWIRDISRTKSSSLVRKADKKATNIGTVLRAVVPPRIGDPIGKEFPEWIKKNTVETDTVIVGGGVAGTAAAFALSEKGENSVIVERGSSIAPATASSNGDSRMYRRMYSSEFFSKMQSKALNRWKDVEEKSGETLLKENGLLFYGEDTGETVEGSVLGAKEIMDKLNLPYTFYASGDEIAARYPSLAGCKGKPYSGVCEDTAGHIRASKGEKIGIHFSNVQFHFQE